MANKRVAMTDEERAERRKQELQLTEPAVAQPALQRRLAAVADRPRPRRAAALQHAYLGGACVVGCALGPLVDDMSFAAARD